MQPLIHKFDHLGIPVNRAMLHDMAVAFAEEQFSRLGRADFMWLIGVHTKIVWIKTNWSDGDEKYRSVQFIRQFIEQLGATCYASIQEAWMASSFAGETDEAKRKRFEQTAKKGVRSLPKNERDDVLIIWSFDRAGGQGASRYLVTIREPRGLNFLGPRDDQSMVMDSLAGPMGNLFRPERDMDEVIKDAQDRAK